MSLDEEERMNQIKAIQQCLTYLSAEAKDKGLPALSILIETAALAANDAVLPLTWDHECRQQFPNLVQGGRLMS